MTINIFDEKRQLYQESHNDFIFYEEQGESVVVGIIKNGEERKLNYFESVIARNRKFIVPDETSIIPEPFRASPKAYVELQLYNYKDRIYREITRNFLVRGRDEDSIVAIGFVSEPFKYRLLTSEDAIAESTLPDKKEISPELTEKTQTLDCKPGLYRETTTNLLLKGRYKDSIAVFGVACKFQRFRPLTPEEMVIAENMGFWVDE